MHIPLINENLRLYLIEKEKEIGVYGSINKSCILKVFKEEVAVYKKT